MYETKCWAVKKEDQRMHVAGMRMLRWMSRVTKRDIIRNGYIRGSLVVAQIDAKLSFKMISLKWFGHVKCRDVNNPIKRVANLRVPERSSRKELGEMLRQDMFVKGIYIGITQDRK
ncbi:uncharacterized protein [Diabrotica undecimpunctata]|uniref:uncharacterized protein n=1 Tax=Diabrotica undecimpunctata TaxID=50387 RepID=UPI003B636FEE